MREMKDSGIEWIGGIPVDWKVIKNKYLLSFLYSGGTPSVSNNDFYCLEGGTPFVSIRDMSTVDYVVSTQKRLTDGGLKDKNLRILPRGTILYSIYATVGAISELKIEAAISQAILALQVNSNVDKSFYKYNLMAMKDYIFSNTNGNTQFNLNVEKVKNFYCTFPAIKIQHHIADYLDRKCSQIDAIIDKVQAEIEKLKEYKLSVITEAVTKGLNPNVPMKDSGIEWIGEIPCDWELAKLKYTALILRGKFNHRPRNDPRYYDGKYPFIQTGDVARANKFITQYTQSLNDNGYAVSKEFPANSICMTIAANVGDVAILTFNACFPDSVVGFVPLSNVNWNYLYYVLKAMKTQLLRNAIISTQLNLNIEIIKEEKIPVASLLEQEKIATYLDNKCASIDSTIENKQKVIDCLTKYKKSLIYEVVTGKKEV